MVGTLPRCPPLPRCPRCRDAVCSCPAPRLPDWVRLTAALTLQDALSWVHSLRSAAARLLALAIAVEIHARE